MPNAAKSMQLHRESCSTKTLAVRMLYGNQGLGLGWGKITSARLGVPATAELRAVRARARAAQARLRLKRQSAGTRAPLPAAQRPPRVTPAAKGESKMTSAAPASVPTTVPRSPKGTAPTCTAPAAEGKNISALRRTGRIAHRGFGCSGAAVRVSARASAPLER